MIFMLTATYGESEISTPIWAIGEPSGPMLNGITYIVRPRIEPLNRPAEDRLHLGRIHPVVGRAGVLAGSAADVGAILDPGHIAGVGPGQEAVGTQLFVQLDERAGIDHLLCQLVVFLVGAVAPVHLVRFAQLGHLGDP